MSEPRPSDCDAPTGERERILVAFVELVVEHGYADLDIALVCERAGAGRRAFGRHFPDRSACFTAAWDLLESIYLDRLAVVWGQFDNWRDRFRASVLETARLIEVHPTQARFLAVETLAAGDRERRRQQELATRLSTCLDRVRSELDDPGVVPLSTSNWVLAVCFDRVYRHLASGRERDLAAQLPELMFLAISLYFGAEAGLAELRPPPS